MVGVMKIREGKIQRSFVAYSFMSFCASLYVSF